MLTRRALLKLGALAGAVAAGGSAGWYWLRGRTVAQLDPPQRELLRAYVDVLVPADDLSPGALDLGIDRELLRASDEDAWLRTLVTRASEPLQQAARRQGYESFAHLPMAARIELVRAAEGAAPKSPSRRLFQRLRDETLERYYARPESWRALRYSGPPQPLGFTDYTEAPRRST